jgi:hypothetical protein
VMINMLSNHHEPYTIEPPLWYLDYFAANGFLDCKVYVLVFSPDGANTFCINLDWLLDATRHVTSFTSPYEMGVLVFAEKGEDSTADIFPAQQHYRSDAEWNVYRKNVARFKNSPRPHLARSRSPISFFDARGGHLFMNSDFQAVDPATEAARIRNIAVPPHRVPTTMKHAIKARLRRIKAFIPNIKKARWVTMNDNKKALTPLKKPSIIIEQLNAVHGRFSERRTWAALACIAGNDDAAPPASVS